MFEIKKWIIISCYLIGNVKIYKIERLVNSLYKRDDVHVECQLSAQNPAAVLCIMIGKKLRKIKWTKRGERRERRNKGTRYIILFLFLRVHVFYEFLYDSWKIGGAVSIYIQQITAPIENIIEKWILPAAANNKKKKKKTNITFKISKKNCAAVFFSIHSNTVSCGSSTILLVWKAQRNKTPLGVEHRHICSLITRV